MSFLPGEICRARHSAQEETFGVAKLLVGIYSPFLHRGEFCEKVLDWFNVSRKIRVDRVAFAPLATWQ
jgi:hypothetical protein